MTEPSHSYSLLLPFDTDDPEFVRGFEAGRVWAELNASDDGHTATVHASNAEMMMRIGEQTGRGVSSQDLDERWVTVAFDAPGDNVF